MNEHERSLALAAAAIDFPLTHEEVEVLGRHLAACPACAEAAGRMREDATSLATRERLPAPPQVRQAVMRAALGGPTEGRRGAGLRWSFAAAVLALLAVGGTFVAGAVLERLRDPSPTDPAIVAGPTHRPTPTRTRRPATTPGPTRVSATMAPIPSGVWQDMGDLTATFEGRAVQMVLQGPDLVAIGRDRRTTLPVVWTSDDAMAWNETSQPDEVFGGRVPTSGAHWRDRGWVVGWSIEVAAAQRAIWSSADGETWSLVDDPSALLGTEASELRIVVGAAGLLVWAPDGRVWTSTDGLRWDRSDIGSRGVTDAAVDGSTFYLVGRDGGRAFVVTSTDGVSWSDPGTWPAAADAQVGIELDASGMLLAWIGDRPLEVTRDGWRERGGAASMPSVADPQDIVGGGEGFAAFATPTDTGVQRAWVSDGTHDWELLRSEPASGSRSIVGVIGGNGWYVLTRQGTTYRGWALWP
jgi:hypothetical protein